MPLVSTCLSTKIPVFRNSAADKSFHKNTPTFTARCIGGEGNEESFSLQFLDWKNMASRRKIILQTFSSSVIFILSDAAHGEPSSYLEEPVTPRYYKTSSGVKIEEVVEGSGPSANGGNKVELNYVCRRSNGYFVYSTIDQLNGENRPIVVSLSNEKIIPGLKEVLVGMKAGGKRRALIPPALGYVNEDLEPQPEEFGPRRSLLSHMKEPLVFEVQVLKVL